jgi:ankyrin repeat protein
MFRGSTMLRGAARIKSLNFTSSKIPNSRTLVTAVKKEDVNIDANEIFTKALKHYSQSPKSVSWYFDQLSFDQSFSHGKTASLIINEYLNAGLNLEARDELGRTLLLELIRKGHYKEADKIIKLGANINAEDYSGNNIMHYLLEPATSHELKVSFMYKFQAIGVPLNKPNKAGDTAFHLACAKDKNIVKEFMKFKPDLDKANNHGETPLSIAYKHGKYSVLKLLLEHGADPEVAYDSTMILIEKAFNNGHINIVKELADYGAKINISIHPKTMWNICEFLQNISSEPDGKKYCEQKDLLDKMTRFSDNANEELALKACLFDLLAEESPYDQPLGALPTEE